MSGTAVAAKNFAPKCQVIGIEPDNADDADSFFPLENSATRRTPANNRRRRAHPVTRQTHVERILDNVDAIETVSEDAIKDAVRFLFYRMKMVVEPSRLERRLGRDP